MSRLRRDGVRLVHYVRRSSAVHAIVPSPQTHEQIPHRSGERRRPHLMAVQRGGRRLRTSSKVCTEREYRDYGLQNSAQTEPVGRDYRCHSNLNVRIPRCGSSRHDDSIPPTSMR